MKNKPVFFFILLFFTVLSLFSQTTGTALGSNAPVVALILSIIGTFVAVLDYADNNP